MTKCAVCNDTGFIQVNILGPDENGTLEQTGARLQPCPFGCSPNAHKKGVSGNSRISGKEVRLSKGDLDRMRKNKALREDAKMLEKHAKKGKKTVDGDYTITTFSVPIEDYYGLKKKE
jgi:hypothetical protein